MQYDITQELIKNILHLSKENDNKLHGQVQAFVDLYNQQVHTNQKLQKENEFFSKKYNQRNILDSDKKDKIIEQQSRLAAMGEMIDAVAHQWKQPLNAISMMMDLLQDDFQTNDVDSVYITDLEETVHLQIDHMVSTLHEFRSFLRPSTKNENFHINTVIQSVQILMKDELITQNVHIDVNIENNLEIFGNKNELKHLFINLINNSIDAFNEKRITSRFLSIKSYKKEKNTFIEIQDNAGGIPQNIIDNIFKPHVTTKAEGKGTGIGLYMSSQIVNKNNGSISVRNNNDGALFIVSLVESDI